MHIANKNVVVTGASSGIGEALARAIARRGGRVVLAARRGDRLHAIAASLRESGAETHAVTCDVTRRAEIRALICQAHQRLGSIDILINNAGVSAYGLFERTDDAEFQRLIAVNLFGPWYATTEVLPLMRSQGVGMVVNVASVAALHGPPYLAAYAATKAALAAMTQSQSAELADTGIRMMVVYPGYTDTELFGQERRTGGARRPRTSYADVTHVADSIVRGIERERRTLVLSPEGHAVSLLTRFLPSAMHGVMRVVAARLAQPIEARDV